MLSGGKLNPTEQVWVNQLVGFNLNLHHKPGKTNTGADYLRRFHQDISKHSKMIWKDAIDKLVNSVTEGKEDTSTWLSSISSMNSLMTVEKQQMKDIVLKELAIAGIQDLEKDIRRVKEILSQQIVLTVGQQQQESQLMRRLLQERNTVKVSIANKDILVRSTLDNEHIILSSSPHCLTYIECIN